MTNLVIRVLRMLKSKIRRIGLKLSILRKNYKGMQIMPRLKSKPNGKSLIRISIMPILGYLPIRIGTATNLFRAKKKKIPLS